MILLEELFLRGYKELGRVCYCDRIGILLVIMLVCDRRVII